MSRELADPRPFHDDLIWVKGSARGHGASPAHCLNLIGAEIPACDLRIALRHHDLRPLQRRLMALALSSPGRLESRVLPLPTAMVVATIVFRPTSWKPDALA